MTKNMLKTQEELEAMTVSKLQKYASKLRKEYKTLDDILINDMIEAGYGGWKPSDGPSPLRENEDFARKDDRLVILRDHIRYIEQIIIPLASYRIHFGVSR